MTTVDKGLLSALRRPKAAEAVVRTGVTRAGRVGVEIEHEGVKGWGVNHSAAQASWEQNRAMMSKRDVWEANLEVPIVPEYRGRRANYRSGTAAVGKRMGAVTGVAAPKKVQGTRIAARTASAVKIPTIPKIDNSPPIPPNMVGKALNEAQRRRLFQVGARMNRGKDEQRAEMAAQSQRHIMARTGERAERGANHPTRAARRRGVDQHKIYDELNNRAVASRSLETNRSRTNVFKRDRRYNPEHNRQRRLGAAAAATGVAGALLTHRGVQGIRESTRLSRRGLPFAPTAGKPHVLVELPEGKKRMIPVPERELQRAGDLHSRGIMASRGDLKRLGGGVGLLGASAGLTSYSRGRSNREWR